MNFWEKKLWQKINRGLIVIDKMPGRTSHDEVFILRKNLTAFFGQKIKVGHSGTLDPKVSGVLVCGIEQGTKALEYILLAEKIYLAEFLFHQKIELNIYRQVVKKFIGKIKQIPPQKSAVKRVEREREIYQLKILKFADNERSAQMYCAVERGTYIRKLAHNLGEEIGVNISMGNLRRISAGPFSEKNNFLIKNDDLQKLLQNFLQSKFIRWKIFYYFKIKKYIYSLEFLFNSLNKMGKIKKVLVKKEALKFLQNGVPMRVKNIEKIMDWQKGEIVSLFYKNNLLAVGMVRENISVKKSEPEQEIIFIKKLFI